MVRCAWECMCVPVNEKGMKSRIEKREKKNYWEESGQRTKRFETATNVFVLWDIYAKVVNTETVLVVGI